MAPPEGCPGEGACPLLADRLTARDVSGTLDALPIRWRWLTLGLPPAAQAAVADHLAATVALLRGGGPSALAAAVDALAPERRKHELVHATEHLLSAAGRALAAAGFLRQQAGVVDGLFAGSGLPKPPVERAEVGRRGLAGDLQRNRKHHGRPSQALCLWSAEVVEALALGGHPIAAGRAGENVSIRGVDWAAVRPGSRLDLGGIPCEISGWALPCAQNRRWFVPTGRSKKAELRIDPDRHPGWARAYAFVLASPGSDPAGTIAVGDAATFS